MEAISFDNLAAQNLLAPQANANWHLLPLFSLALHLPDEPERQRIEGFIHQRFAHQYGADISVFLPLLLSAADDKGTTAALGFQPATEAPLFLEQYLDCDIETMLSLMTQSDIRRHSVVEIGNLASGRQRATQTLFLLLAQILHGAGYEWVVFTANRAVRIWLARMQLPAFVINEADPQRLTDKGVNWGTYYDDRPVVLAANIEHSFSYMNTHPLMAHLRDSYANQIERFADRLPR